MVLVGHVLGSTSEDGGPLVISTFSQEWFSWPNPSPPSKGAWGHVPLRWLNATEGRCPTRGSGLGKGENTLPPSQDRARGVPPNKGQGLRQNPCAGLSRPMVSVFLGVIRGLGDLIDVEKTASRQTTRGRPSVWRIRLRKFWQPGSFKLLQVPNTLRGSSPRTSRPGLLLSCTRG